MADFKVTRMFRTVWRINAALILVVGVLAFVTLTGVLFFFWKDASRTRQVDNVANIVPSEVDKRSFQLGNFEPVAGQDVLRAPLAAEESYRFGSGSKEAGSVRNYLYLDPLSRQTRWLKKDFDSLIVEAKSLPESEYNQPRKSVQVNVYTLVVKDTNQDQRLSRNDAKQIAISKPDGSGFRVLVPEADRVNEVTIVRGNTLLILYSLRQKLVGAELPLAELEAPPKSYEIDLGKALSTPD